MVSHFLFNNYRKENAWGTVIDLQNATNVVGFDSSFLIHNHCHAMQHVVYMFMLENRACELENDEVTIIPDWADGKYDVIIH